MTIVTPPTKVTTYASIMVAVDDPNIHDRLNLAANLSDRFSSRLIGIAARMVPALYFVGAPGVEPPGIETERQRIADVLREAEREFRRLVAGRTNIEWRSDEADTIAYICEQARSADLVIVGRPSESSVARLHAEPADLVMELGRPLLFVPPHLDYLSAQRILVAWKDTREARRALIDSLPFLRTAKDVCIATVGSDSAAAKDVGTYLAQHGIPSTSFSIAQSEKETGEELVSIARQQGADLIVCGAYGHSRLREWALGGVTRWLLQNSPICCLMAH